MAIINSGDLNNVNDLLDSLSDLTRQGDLTSESLRELDEEGSDSSSTLKKLGTEALKTVKNIVQFSGALAGGNDKMTALNGIITGAAKSLGKFVPIFGPLIEGMGKATAFSIEQNQTAFESYQKLAKAGVSGAEGITSLVDQFSKTGVPLEMFTSMLLENSADLADLYGSGLQGADKFAETMEAMNQKGNDQLRNLGFTTEEIGKTIINFQKNQQRMGFSQTLSAQELQVASTKYGKELDLLAKITGKSRETIQQERNERMLETKFRTHIENKRKKLISSGKTEDEAQVIIDNMQQYLSSFSKLGKQAYLQAKASMIGAANDINARQAMMNGTFNLFQKNVESIINGADVVSVIEKGQQGYGKIVGAFVSQFGETLEYIGDTIEVIGEGAQYYQAEMLSKAIKDGTYEKMRAALSNQSIDPDEITKTAAAYQKAAQGATSIIQSTALSFNLARDAVDTFTKLITGATDEIRSFNGIDTIDERKMRVATGDSEKHMETLTDLDNTKKEITETKKQLAIAERSNDKDLIIYAEEKLADLEMNNKKLEEKNAYYKTKEGKIEKLNEQISKNEDEKTSKATIIFVEAFNFFAKELGFFNNAITRAEDISRKKEKNASLESENEKIRMKREKLQKTNSPVEAPVESPVEAPVEVPPIEIVTPGETNNYIPTNKTNAVPIPKKQIIASKDTKSQTQNGVDEITKKRELALQVVVNKQASDDRKKQLDATTESIKINSDMLNVMKSLTTETAKQTVILAHIN